MIRRTVVTPLAAWVAKATASGVPELARFAAGVQADGVAVAAALTEVWSDGQVEGQVNRLKIAAADCPDCHSPSLGGYIAGSAVDGVPRAGRLGPPTPAGRTGRSPMSEPRRPQRPPAR